MHDLMNIHQLAAAAAAALNQAQLAQSSGRVAEVPQVRTVRFYTTHGLIDPPAAFQGRRALYTTRHLLQLVAIKQLQALGMELDAIQTRLLGASDATLAEIAHLPADALASLTANLDATEQADDDSFWRQEPALPSAPRHDDTVHATSYEPVITGLRLAAELTILIERSPRALQPDDIASIQAAAAPLLQVLRARKLIQE